MWLFVCVRVQRGGSERYLLVLFSLCDSLCMRVFVRVTEQKVMRQPLCGRTWVPPTFRCPKWGISEDARSHLHNTPETNTFTPPPRSLSLSLSFSLPGLMRESLFLAEGLLLLPIEARWLFLLPGVQTLPLQILLLGLWTFPQGSRRHLDMEMWNCIPKPGTSIVYIISNGLCICLFLASAALTGMRTVVQSNYLSISCYLILLLLLRLQGEIMYFYSHYTECDSCGYLLFCSLRVCYGVSLETNRGCRYCAVCFWYHSCKASESVV